jgi:hypothetical protein
MDSNKAILQKLLHERESGQAVNNSRFATINDFNLDIHRLRQACLVFAYGNQMRSAFMPVMDDGPG